MKKPSIDITSQVMAQISARQLKVRPRGYFIAIRLGQIMALLAVGSVAILSLASIVFSYRLQQFSEYLSQGFNGTINYVSSIPWLGILVTLAGLVVVSWLLKLVLGQRRFNYAAVTALVVFVMLFGVLAGWQAVPGSTVSKIANGYRLGQNPEKVKGVVKSINIGQMIVSSEGKDTIVQLNGSHIVANKQLTEGDTVLILGIDQQGQLKAKLIKLVETTKLNSQLEPVKVVAEKTEIPIPQEKPAEQPSKISIPAISNPAPTATPASPPPAPNPMTITQSTFYPGSPAKFKILLSLTYSSSNIFKLLWSTTTSSPTYPANYYGAVFSGGYTYIKNNITPSGTYYLRACEHDGTSCIRYSPTITVTFP